ncbi:hypothetical protein A9Q99_00050 [Gammaproteobacteria bacterium 45_16_T64]|nr:hypothetical protein A9Q99_00050 [Gammaproteobacteria bacterium 45_16_T64]
MILSLLFQVQAVFACEMMEKGGLKEQCCCDEVMEPHRASRLVELASECCDFSEEVTLSSSDADSISIQTHVIWQLEESPDDVLYSVVLSLIFSENYYPSVNLSSDWDVAPSTLGTNTYIRTQRFRI